MSLIGRKPPTAAELDPFGYWSKPKPAGKWVETFPSRPGNARSEHFVPSKRPLSPGLDMPRGGYDSGVIGPFPGPRTPRQLRSSVARAAAFEKRTGMSSWKKATANGKLNRGAIRKAIDEGELEARFWLRTDDQVDYRRDTNNPWLPARVSPHNEDGFMVFDPSWFKDRSVRAYKRDDGGEYVLAVTHNHILQLRDRA